MITYKKSQTYFFFISGTAVALTPLHSQFKQIGRKTGLKVYFVDPYSAWQRGYNENTNGLLRQYCRKGSDFSKLTDSKLAKAVKKLNHRLRKCLGYRTPHEVLFKFNGALGT